MHPNTTAEKGISDAQTLLESVKKLLRIFRTFDACCDRWIIYYGDYHMSLVISEKIIKASGLSAEELLQELILVLFQQDKISLGKAAELLDLSQISFQKLIAERGINIHYDLEEWQEDIQHLRSKGWL